MKRFTYPRTLLAVTLLSGLTATNVLAQDKLISDAVKPGDTDSKWLAGVTLGGVENPFVGEEDKGIGYANINLEYRGEKLFLGQDGLGYNLMRNRGFSTGIILSGKMSYLHDEDWYEDNEVLADLDERQGTLDVGLYMIHNTRVGQLRLRALEEVSGQHKGHSVDATYIFDYKVQGWRINPYVTLAYESADTVDYFYGVSAGEANAQRVAYVGEAAVNVTAGINARYQLTQNWELGVGTSITKLGEGIADSSLIEDDTLYSASLTANYNF